MRERPCGEGLPCEDLKDLAGIRNSIGHQAGHRGAVPEHGEAFFPCISERF